MVAPGSIALTGLEVSDPPQRWQALGFREPARDDGCVCAGAARIVLGVAPPGRGIVAWTLAGDGAGDVGGLTTRWRPAGTPRLMTLARGLAAAIDHVVVITPAFDALIAELAERDLRLKRVTEIRGRRTGFRRLGGPILEVVEAPDAAATAFWGVTFAVHTAVDLDRLCASNRLLSAPRPAVQPGRRIATVSRDAGLSTRVAFIDPEPAA